MASSQVVLEFLEVLTYRRSPLFLLSMKAREPRPGSTARRRAKGGPGTLEIHHLGPHPLIEHYLDRLGMRRILDKHIHSNRSGVLSHGQAIAVLIHNILTSRDPLYRLSEWAEPIEPQALGLTSEQKLALNDDRIGRALDQLAEFGGKGVFFQLALRSIKLFELDTTRIHHDTTSITFSGNYRSSKRTPRITHGHNKDHRPDLKQLVFGLNVTSDGAVPVSHGVYSGNRTDDTIHRQNIQDLRDLLERDDFIYVADCKLCTKKNLKFFEEFDGRFVTVLPRTRSEDKDFRAKLRYKAARWRTILSVEDPKHPGVFHQYETCPGPFKSEDGFRLIWIRSSAKAEQDQETREKKLEQAQAALADLAGRINQRTLKTRKQIQKAVRGLLKEFGCEQFLMVGLVPRRITTYKRLRPGRPSPGDAKKTVTKTEYSLEITINKTRLRQEHNLDGVFPLITNLPASKKDCRQGNAVARSYKPLDVLQIYRYQPYVERRFENIKTEYSLTPAYLKKPQRIVGLVHAHFLALTVGALLEREVRRNMHAQGIHSIPIYPEERECKAPTGPRIFELFARADWFRHVGRKETATYPINLTELQLQVLRLLGVPKTHYQMSPDHVKLDLRR